MLRKHSQRQTFLNVYPLEGQGADIQSLNLEIIHVTLLAHVRDIRIHNFGRYK